MSGYGHPLEFGAFLTPDAARPQAVVELARLAERAGLDLVTFQDHPYQPAFVDTWTLLSYVAASTSTVRVAPNVLNLPLRLPAMIARSAASLDRLSGGRLELGLGAGAFWDAIVAMGGRRLAPAQAVRAIEEAIEVIRGVWATDERGVLRVDGEFYSVHGAKRGPAPAHPIGIWLGAYKPRMLALIGRVADGWLPSLGYVTPEDLAAGNAIIDEAAVASGRRPNDVRRLLNISETEGAEQLAELALRDGISTFILGSDDPSTLQRFGEEVAPAVRELVDAERAPERAPAARLSTGTALLDESTRPSGSRPPAEGEPAAGAAGQHLVDVHDHLRAELTRLRDIAAQVLAGSADAAHARSVINEMTMRQNNWTLGAYCASYCRVLTQHHSLEDAAVFPYLRSREAGLEPVIDRALVEYVHDPAGGAALQRAVDVLADGLLSHLAYEERELVEPLDRYGFYEGRL